MSGSLDAWRLSFFGGKPRAGFLFSPEPSSREEGAQAWECSALPVGFERFSFSQSVSPNGEGTVARLSCSVRLSGLKGFFALLRFRKKLNALGGFLSAYADDAARAAERAEADAATRFSFFGFGSFSRNDAVKIVHRVTDNEILARAFMFDGGHSSSLSSLLASGRLALIQDAVEGSLPPCSAQIEESRAEIVRIANSLAAQGEIALPPPAPSVQKPAAARPLRA